MSLKWTALLPTILAAGYCGLILYFRAMGGYKPLALAKTDHAEEGVRPMKV